MYLQRLLQINMATLAALGALLLSMGQRNVGLALSVSIAAIGSVWLTDVTGWFRLNRIVANAAAVAAVLISLRHLRFFGGEVDILGIAHMLVYLQIILLFQEKDRRIYWQLVMLSLLQVVVAAALNQGVWFGLLLVIYMLAGLSAMALLFLYSQWSQHRSDAESATPLLAPGGRWPLAGQRPKFTGTVGGPMRVGIVRELFGRLAMVELGTLLLTLLLFLTVPRFGQTAWRGVLTSPKRVVGFSDQVILGELGEILESNEEVMRVTLTEASSGEPYPVLNELYLRGAILTRYDEGHWEDRTPGRRRIRPLPSASTMPEDQVVLQEIVVEPLSRDELFCVWPCFRPSGPSDELAGVRLQGERLLRPRRDVLERFSYKLATTAFIGGVQVSLAPCRSPVDLRPLRQMPKVSQLEGLKRLAQQWIDEGSSPEDDRISRASSLARRFHESRNGFQYSLEGRSRDLSLDPLEDFVVNNRQGHCEYFATALAMMLRSQGIPSRVVVGYKSAEFDKLSQCYHVRQSHAHAWVEAYLERQHIPPGRLDENASRWDHGGWLRLEPTPGTLDAQGGGAGARLVGQIEQRFQRLQSLWANYVMEMDRRRQREAVYKPISDAIRYLRDPDWWRSVLHKVGNALDVLGLGRAGRWLGVGLAALLAATAVVFGRRRLRRFLGRLWGWLAGRGAPAASSYCTEVEFYRRLETLLARHGLRRSAGQTQQEFAAAAGRKIVRTTGQDRLEPLPGQIVDAFYRVRFGHLPLDNHQAKAVEHALAELAASAEGP